MGTGLGAQVGLGKDDDIQRLCEPFVEQLRLVAGGLDVSLHRSLFEVLPWYVVVIHLAAIFAMGPPPGIGADVREVQSGIASQLEIDADSSVAPSIRAWWLPKCPSSTK